MPDERSPVERLLVERAGLIRKLKNTTSLGRRQVASRRVLDIDTELNRLRKVSQ